MEGVAQNCPPGRLGGFAALGEPGYRAVSWSGNAQQMALYVRRAAAFYGGDVTDDAALTVLAQEHCARPRSYSQLLGQLNSLTWISWPGLKPLAPPSLQRSASTHSPTSVFGEEETVEASFGMPVEGRPPSSSTEDAPTSPALADGSSIPSAPAAPEVARDSVGSFLPSVHGACHAACDVHSNKDTNNEKKLEEASLPSAQPLSQAQAIHGLNEVHLDSIQLCSQPFEEFGPLIIAAPPLRPWHMYASRMFSLVLRNPRDPSRGLVLMTNISQSVVSQTATGILEELGAIGPSLVSALSDSAVYEALNHDPALLSAVVESTGAGASGLPQLLVSVAGFPSGAMLSTPNATHMPSTSAASSSSPSQTAAASGASPNTSPVLAEDETGDCPICYECIAQGDAAMRCCGEGGTHHYFHATCLRQWIRTCRDRNGATCPICRGRLQFNGERLNSFLRGEQSAALDDDERSFLQSVADGLSGRNQWGDMSTVERTAYAGGMVAAVGWGFMLGFSGSHRAQQASSDLFVHLMPQEHQIAQGVGWAAGLLARIIREAMRERNTREESGSRPAQRRRHS